ncbi:MAG TPA: sulfite exporter TauE/SafE family protein [Blastocatellia bacterium]|jgi:uncharacterized membrane protein YfcA|nr:sulfite exporter TauE/SafE family protein [Blastocatellia bacterium]
MSIWQSLIIFAAAFVAGMINSVAGGGTLISFPALVWVGRDVIIANATSAVALWPGSLGGLLGYRRELGDTRKWMLWFGLPSIAGGILGAVLLLRTPPRTFAAIVPYLIFFATILFAAQERITRALRASDAPGQDPPETGESLTRGRAWWAGAILFQFLVAVYGGYFGAGIGILMLAALGLLGLTDIHQMNGLKNFFALCINGVAAAYFIISGAVNWPDVLIMSAGAIAGGYGGAGLARRLGRAFVRRAVIVIGFAMAVSLLFG